MSKQIKQMEMDALKQTFGGVRDLVVLSVSGLDSTTDNQLRLNLRKKQVRLHRVRNSYARKVFEELDLKVPAGSAYWKGTSVFAWGLGSPAELSRAIKSELDEMGKKLPKLKDWVTIKGGVAEGREVPFDVMIKMPTKVEALGRIVALALSPASRLVSQLTAPAGRVAAQLKTLSEKGPESAPEGAPAV
jgi:ribosomal protein L10